MRPVPASFLLTLLIALCVLCAWQWHRENSLRKVIMERSEAFAVLEAERAEIETRVKATDAEILRLTGLVSELRTNSVSKVERDDLVKANTQMRESIEKQNAVVKELNESVTKANASIQQANENVKKLAAERDELAKKVNEVTERYNALAKKGGG